MKRDNGGVRCLDDIRDRCYINEETGCWEWRRGMSASRCPTVYFPKTEKIEQVTRLAYEFRIGPIPPKHIVWRSCWSHVCVNPDHFCCGTRRAFGAAIRASGVQKGLPTKIAANARMGRARRKVNDEQIAKIRQSDETLEVLAARYGLSTYAVSLYRRGIRGRAAANSSVFAWRP